MCALQPFVASCDEGAIRRAANVLLALEYRRSEKSITFETVVNERDFEKLKLYSEKGELHSTALRDDLLSTLFISERACIRALTTIGREVFGEDKIFVASLVRELVHDRLMIHSEFYHK